MTVLTLIACLSLLTWLWLTFCQGGFWRTDVRLPPGRADGPRPSVAVVVPARDEAEVLPLSLPSLLAQRYAGEARVVLVDDGSTDGTGELARHLGAAPGALPLTVTSPGEPPTGWTGKLWALRHGVELAGDVDYLLLTDADIAHEPDSLERLVASAESGYDLVSQMARLSVRTRWEQLIVPAFVYFFAQLYPFRWSNKPGSRTAAAAGGCTLVRREALARAGGVAAIRGAVIDDVNLARLVKRGGGRTWLGLADHVDSVRPYPELGQLWRMVSRSAYAQLRHNVFLLIGTVLGLVLVYLVPPVLTVVGALVLAPTVALPALAAWALMTYTFRPMLAYYGRPAREALLLPFTAALYLLMTVDSAIQHWRGRGAAWKGRTYPAPMREGREELREQPPCADGPAR
ncbi:glycosyltransferase [Streptacidiphilus jiangxiensis]|uniref:Hopene-associated glycosyltransferase HpnB n=1 Tax=Streptacidiphilus jiangxiensis TaxID=235985 RepID=A0A1H7U9M6_STRJI|nr:glycosyltransferase [Streptacidiphilus jiangxiensis]SEL93398.1 hopene-associated glycosyltransferase HpnB [Streptacidiphilus jiangxiensis]